MESGTTRRLIRQQGVVAILVGVIFVLVANYLRLTYPPGPGLLNAFLSFLETIGIALIGFGFFGIIVDTASWRDYFSSRLREIVIEQSYLNTLDPDTLNLLQTRTLKALFHDPTIDREGSFLNYFHLNLHQYISQPYREDVTSEIFLVGEIGGGIEIRDKVSYVCRKAGVAIQERVNWAPDPEEFISIRRLKVEVQYPYWHERKGERKTLADKDLSKEDMKTYKFSEPLTTYKDVDGLIVSVESTYVVDVERFQYWQMAHPTKNFHLTLSFPREFTIQLKSLVLHPELVQTSLEDGFARVKYDSWMLPQSGVAWRFVKRAGAPAAKPTSPQAGAGLTSVLQPDAGHEGIPS